MDGVWYVYGGFLFKRDGEEREGVVYGTVEAETSGQIEALLDAELIPHYGQIRWNDGPNFASIEAIAEWLQGFNMDIRDQIALIMAVTRRAHLGTSVRGVTAAGREVSEALLTLANAINELPTVEGIHHSEV